MSVRPFVVKHIEDLPVFPIPSGETSVFSSHVMEKLGAGARQEQEDEDNIYNVRVSHHTPDIKMISESIQDYTSGSSLSWSSVSLLWRFSWRSSCSACRGSACWRSDWRT